MNIAKSIDLFQKAKNLIPGGVDSPVRAFRAVGGQPLFIERGEGPYLYDVDGNRYIDYVLSWGPLILGHADPDVVAALQQVASKGTSFGAPSALEVDLAELVMHFMPNLEMIRFVNSGTEATMTALRLARAYTKRDKILKFEGCYHGHADMLLVQAGSGVATLGLPDSPGVPVATVSDTLVARYNDLEAVEAIFKEQEKHQVDDHDDTQTGQDVAQEEKGVIAQGTEIGHDMVHVVQGQDGDQQQKQDAQIGQALELADHRFHLVIRGGAFCFGPFPRVAQEVVEAGNYDPHEEGDHNGEGEGHKDILPPGKSRLYPVVFIIRSPQDHHDKNDDLHDPDKLEVVEEELFAVGFGEIAGNLGHTCAPWG